MAPPVTSNVCSESKLCVAPEPCKVSGAEVERVAVTPRNAAVIVTNWPKGPPALADGVGEPGSSATGCRPPGFLPSSASIDRIAAKFAGAGPGAQEPMLLAATRVPADEKLMVWRSV